MELIKNKNYCDYKETITLRLNHSDMVKAIMYYVSRLPTTDLDCYDIHYQELEVIDISDCINCRYYLNIPLLKKEIE